MHNSLVQPYLHTNHKRSENFHPMHQTKKNNNLGKETKIVASIKQPCQEAKREHTFSWTNYKEDFSLNPKP
jgi:hypothetical protein